MTTLENSYSYLAIPPTLRLEPSSKRMLGTVENMKLFILMILKDHYLMSSSTAMDSDGVKIS